VPRDVARYVALLRGINVGGKQLVKMTELKARLEEDGLEDVVTYIQSGNVLFSAASPAEALARRIEQVLTDAFGCRSLAVVLNRTQMQRIVTHAPDGFGGQPAKYRYDVIYLKAPLAARAALPAIPANPDVDAVSAGPGVVYFSRLISGASRSRLSKITGLAVYQSVTIRNWNTTTKLLDMMSA